MRFRGYAVVLMVMAAVVGCSSPGHGSAAPAPDPRPLDGATTFSAAQSAALDAAVQKGIVTCMRGRGLQYQAVKAPEALGASVNPYGLLRTDLVYQDGYSISSAAYYRATHQVADPTAAAVAKLSPTARKEWESALYGTDSARRKIVLQYGQGSVTVPTDGCTNQAQVDVYGAAWDDVYSRVQATANEVMARVMADASYSRAVRAWSACMHKAGEPYATTAAARADIQSQVDKMTTMAGLKAIGRRELALSATDYGCERKIHLHEAVADAQARLQPALAKEHAADLVAFARLRAAALARAE